MEYLIATDLEGVGGVVGAPFDKLLPGHTDYDLAVKNATKEVNTAVKALYDSGATLVAVWDNHGGGGNLDFSLIDQRAVSVTDKGRRYRLDLAYEHNFTGIVYIGYHSREGSFGGVLAHTYNSSEIQYCKINGEPVGELEIDSYVAEAHGIVPMFLSSDEACVSQFKRFSPESVTVITKYGKSRNEAQLIDEDKVCQDIYDGVCLAVKKRNEIPTRKLAMPATVEIRYTRAERAAQLFDKAASAEIPVRYGEDTHTLIFEVSKPQEIPFCL